MAAAVRSPEVSALAVLGQDVSARSLEVQHASVKGAIMRVSECDAGGWSRKAVRTAQPWDHGGHLVLGIGTNTLSGGSSEGFPFYLNIPRGPGVCYTDCCTG